MSRSPTGEFEGKRNGGSLVVASLLAHGVDAVFCVPGESFLPVLDALRDVADRIRLIVCRHESAAAHMAEAYAKLTGRPGVCMVTRGPGATQASIGVHTAEQDSTPLVLLVGQVETGLIGRGRGRKSTSARCSARSQNAWSSSTVPNASRKS